MGMYLFSQDCQDEYYGITLSTISDEYHVSLLWRKGNQSFGWIPDQIFQLSYVQGSKNERPARYEHSFHHFQKANASTPLFALILVHQFFRVQSYLSQWVYRDGHLTTQNSDCLFHLL